MGLWRLLTRAHELSEEMHSSFLKEAAAMLWVRPKLSMSRQDWWAYRRLGKETFCREWIRWTRYVRWANQLNPTAFAPLTWNKRLTCERLGEELFGRPWLATRQATMAETLDFWKRHRVLILKPVDGFKGDGIECLDWDIPETKKRATVDKCVGKPFLLEPYIHPHPALAEVMPDSLASLRIHTIRHQEDVRICLLSSIRFGRKGMPTDHHAQSYSVCFNADGELISPKAYCAEALVDIHADSGYRFADFKLPYWEECVALVKKAALRFPEVPYLGWDVAITASGPQIIEVNHISAAPRHLQPFLLLSGYGKGIYRELRTLRHFAQTGEMRWR